MLKSKKNIIWDWNGTLLNDVNISVLAMNELLKEREIPLLNKTRYKAIFGFPVRTYYEKIGFDFSKEPFEVVGLEFMNRYRKISSQAKLTEHAIDILSKFQEKGYRQFVLSAMEQTLLTKMLNDYGIIQYFQAVYGIENDYATEKISIADKLFLEQKIKKSQTIMIGDTLHDAEVAQAMQINCILFSGGHQNKKRLISKHHTIINNLTELI